MTIGMEADITADITADTTTDIATGTAIAKTTHNDARRHAPAGWLVPLQHLVLPGPFIGFELFSGAQYPPARLPRQHGKPGVGVGVSGRAACFGTACCDVKRS